MTEVLLNVAYFAGTMETNSSHEESAPALGAFYVLKDKVLETLFDQVKLSNGLAWSADETKLYYNDSLLFRIDCFDYDAKNVKLSTRPNSYIYVAQIGT